MPQLVVVIPDTADPHMVDQLAAAVQRMGGHILPEEPEPAAPQPQSEGEAINAARAQRGSPQVPTSPMAPPA